MWRTTGLLRDNARQVFNFNPRPPCGGRQETKNLQKPVVRISIHVPRVEDDWCAFSIARSTSYFNPRPPCGGRHLTKAPHSGSYPFQSTSPVWRTTNVDGHYLGGVVNFNPRPPCGGRLEHGVDIVYRRLISIHVPRVEDDIKILSPSAVSMHFNPRPPCGGRPFRGLTTLLSTEKFQSTSPVWRTTRQNKRKIYAKITFQSTSPVWRTTASFDRRLSIFSISIHVPRVEDDSNPRNNNRLIKHFNPRPPCGGRRG